MEKEFVISSDTTYASGKKFRGLNICSGNGNEYAVFVRRQQGKTAMDQANTLQQMLDEAGLDMDQIFGWKSDTARHWL